MEQISYIPNTSPMKLDVMVGNSFNRTVSLPCMVGVEYQYEELCNFIRRKFPSLKNVDFTLIPSGKPRFR